MKAYAYDERKVELKVGWEDGGFNAKRSVVNKIHRLGEAVAVGGVVWYTHQAWRVQSELRRLGGF